ncbi:Mor transcription activator family protein [Ectopseudomonas oleovorans]|uniref:Putative integral membrane protein n=1 Tax=Ectopseudomonas oleovorans (strain CECT 5344) TaxID=1182590 RepID=W6R2D3_ECTO5|nr:Mor transcription activator family protein [Pseudomonas oleovorans]CDM42408.1 putative integral membrane protein [Pseudomonas oleovorans CECT 5344]CDR93031.1 putative integral membrane protein [Pseudomonas oleovorans]
MDLSQLQELLPENVRDMAARIGLPATLRVVERMGGTTWRVAEGRTPEGEAKRAALADIVGSDIEEMLHREYAGDEFYLARCHAAVLRWRNLEIHQRFEQGVREGLTARTLVAELAREYRLSDRRVWIILKEHLPPVEQGTLFH